MSMTNNPARSLDGATTTPGIEPRDRPIARTHRKLRETKPSFMTTEFWAMLSGIALLVVVYTATDNPDLTLWRTCLLSTVIASAYIVSRGWSKAGSHDDVERESSRY